MRTITLDNDLAFFLETQMAIRANALRERASRCNLADELDRKLHAFDIRDAERCETAKQILRDSWYVKPIANGVPT